MIDNDVLVDVWALQGRLDWVVRDLGVQAMSIQRTVSPADGTPRYSAVLVRISSMAMGDGSSVADAIISASGKLETGEGKQV